MQTGTQATITIEGHDFILSKEKDDRLEIVHHHYYARIGKGAFGTVDKVLHVTTEYLQL